VVLEEVLEVEALVVEVSAVLEWEESEWAVVKMLWEHYQEFQLCYISKIKNI
jgi:hypothetical protein